MIVGLDLAGSPERPTGVAFLERRLQTCTLFQDEEIIVACQDTKLVAIDAPLSLPKKGALRKCDRDLIRMGYRVLPPLLGGMRALTLRGIRLARLIRKSGTEVIEIHPRTSALILFGEEDRKKWLRHLEKLGGRPRNKHEIDAAVAALTGKLFLEKKTRNVGRIVIPLSDRPSSPRRGPR